MDLRQRIEHVRRRIAKACERCGRQPSTVTLIGVTKGVALEAILEAMRLGLTELGENRVQEARSKREALGLRIAGCELRIEKKLSQSEIQNPKSAIASGIPRVRWHMVGHLQRNKAKEAVTLFDAVHSVDSLPLVQTLEAQCASRGHARPLEVFIQVSVSGEATKFGCRPDDVETLARAATQLPHLRVVGLMTIAPFTVDPETTRPVFRRLRELRDTLHSTLKLSMGMSQDFDVAIEEGADFIRVGTAIFGARDRG